MGFAQPEIYSGTISLITGTWTGNCTVSEVITDNPFDGTTHYRIDYSTNNWWTGWGMNMDNWGNTPAIDFTGYDAIQLSYRGLSGTASLVLQLRDANGQGIQVQVGGVSANYTTVTIPLVTFLAGAPVDITAITELSFSTSNIIESYSGTVYIDGIKLTSGAFEGKTTLQTWSRHARMGKGVNFANWLEAFWLIPFDVFPEVNRYNRSVVQNLVDMGFNFVRLPVCFEQFALANPPYTIPQDHIVFDLIDSTIAWSEEMDFDLIITNHHGMEINNSNYQSEIPRKKAIWQQVIDRYGYLNPEKYYFEIYNEPTNAISNNNVHTLMDSVLKTIRAVSPGHTVIIGGNGWNSVDGLLNTQPYADSNIIYTFHSYDPFAFTHQGMSWTNPPYMPATPFPDGPNDESNLTSVIESAAAYSDTSKVPVMLGEFGCSTQADAQSRCNYISTIGAANDLYNMPWYYWDVISPSDAFGFLDGDGDPIACFAEALELGSENTCARLVSVTGNSGTGSLREQLNCAAPGDTVYFDVSLEGDTIHLSRLPLFFNNNVSLINTAPQAVVLDATDSDALLFISPAVDVHLKNIKLLIRTDQAIRNYGVLHLHNTELEVLGPEPLRLTIGVIKVPQQSTVIFSALE